MLIIKLIILIIKIIMFTIKMTWSVWQESMKQFSYEGSRTPSMEKPSVLSRILLSSNPGLGSRFMIDKGGVAVTGAI